MFVCVIKLVFISSCDATSVSWCSVLPGVARLAVDVGVLAVAQVLRAERLAAGVTGGAFAMVGAFLHRYFLRMENLVVTTES